MKKRVLYFFIIIVFVFFGWQLFKYKQAGGNVIIQIGNLAYSEKTIKLNVLVDSKLVFSDALSNRTSSQYRTFSAKTSFGKHMLTINSPELKIHKNIHFHSIIMKWVYIDLVEDGSIPDGKRYKFIVNTSFLPLAVE